MENGRTDQPVDRDRDFCSTVRPGNWKKASFKMIKFNDTHDPIHDDLRIHSLIHNLRHLVEN